SISASSFPDFVKIRQLSMPESTGRRRRRRESELRSAVRRQARCAQTCAQAVVSAVYHRLKSLDIALSTIPSL
ncbi:hypothetical protein TorRG33x02_303390, partial [Trema orientale]